MALITAQNALKKYGIKIAQLQHLVDSNLLILHDEYGSELYKGAELNRLRGQWIDEEANARTPTRGSSRLFGSSYGDDIDEMWQGRLIAEREAKELYSFDNTIGGYFFQEKELEEAFKTEFPEMYGDYATSPQNTSYFISSTKITQQFPEIRESQLYEVIKLNVTKIFDYRGKEIPDCEEFEKLRSGGPYKDNPFLAIRDCIFFVRSQIGEVLANMFPDDISQIGDTATQAQGVEAAIAAWVNILPTLKRAQYIAAQLAIEKWKGKSHLEAFKAVRPDADTKLAKRYVSEKRKCAQKVALQYGLAMPSWRSE